MSDNFFASNPDQVPEPGGYNLIAVMDDGGTLCESCLTDASNPIHDARKLDKWHDGWGVIGWMTSGDTDEFTACDHCGNVIVEQWNEDAS